MISKMNILGPIYMKDFSYKKMGTSALPYTLAILVSGKAGCLARGFSERGPGRQSSLFLSEAWRGTIEFKKGVG
jgi:hypothetical protein